MICCLFCGITFCERCKFRGYRYLFDCACTARVRFAPSYCHILVMSCFSEDPPLPSDLLLATAYFHEPPLPHIEDPPLPSDILGTASEADGPQLQELCNVVQLPCDLLRKRKIYSCSKHNCIQQSASLAAFKLWEEKKATLSG